MILRAWATWLCEPAQRQPPGGSWDHAVAWIVSDWTPRVTAQGLTHIANVVSPESLAALSAEAVQVGLSDRLQMRVFGTGEEAQAWIRAAHEANLLTPPRK